VNFNRKQLQVQQPSQIGLPDVLQPTEIHLQQLCVCVTGLGFLYIMLFTVYVQFTGKLLSFMHFCAQGNTDFWFRIKKIKS
jgi:hypothetical protein